jgi:hypothetical protein
MRLLPEDYQREYHPRWSVVEPWQMVPLFSRLRSPFPPSPVSPSSSPSRLRTWLQLFRAPNLFTVPGDPLVGFLFANGWQIDRSLLFVILASLCFYTAGLLMNDLADHAEDRRDRPDRPIPSGAVERSTVWLVLGLLCVAGLVALALTGHWEAEMLGGALLAAIALYNWVTKSWPVVGALNMGLCRGLSVMLGAVVGPQATWPMSMLGALAIGLYIAAVTNLARHETKKQAPVLARCLPFLAAALCTAPGMRTALDAPDKVPAIFLFLLMIGAAGWLAWKMFTTRTPLPPLIGAHIRLLLPLQAACCYLAEPTEYGRYAALALLCLWPVARLVSRWFYAS